MNEINTDDEIVVRKFICDMVERHFIKGMKGHMAHLSCEMCYAPGNGPSSRVDYDYPRSTTYAARTDSRWRLVAR